VIAAMRLIFLDFDGVLNSPEHFRAISGKRPGHEWDSLDPAAVRRLNRIIDATGASVVISSSWRHGRSVEQLAKTLEGAGFLGRVIAKTPDFMGRSQRGDEIAAWLNAAIGIGRLRIDGFVVLDDDDDMDAVRDRFIKTSFHHGGLLDEHVERAIAMLR
jgi:hypothetical protein